VDVLFPYVKKADPDRPGSRIDDYMEPAQRELLQNPSRMIDMMYSYDKDNIPERVIQRCARLIDAEFDPLAMKKCSLLAEVICLWARAIYKYHFLARAIEPIRQHIQQLEASMEPLSLQRDALLAKVNKVQKDMSLTGAWVV